MKVYALTRGVYSDYRVAAIFDSKTLLETYRAHFPDSEYNEGCEEYELNPNQVLIRKGLHYWFVEMFRDGRLNESPEERHPDYYCGHDPPTVQDVYMPRVRLLRGQVLAKTAEHAVKIVNEKRIQLIATGAWPE